MFILIAAKKVQYTMISSVIWKKLEHFQGVSKTSTDITTGFVSKRRLVVHLDDWQSGNVICIPVNKNVI